MYMFFTWLVLVDFRVPGHGYESNQRAILRKAEALECGRRKTSDIWSSGFYIQKEKGWSRGPLGA